MVTIKQLEALIWVVRLGGFTQAAHHLHTTQSAISKRIGELEQGLGAQLLDRSLRTARLTDKGRELFRMGERLLDHYQHLVEEIGRTDTVTRHLRIGVTELTALTWLPRLVEEIGRVYPAVTIEQEVTTSVNLLDGLAKDNFDVVFIANIHDRRQIFERVEIGTVENVWMCAPKLAKDFRRGTTADLERYSILVQGDRSGSWMQYDNWLRLHQINMRNVRFCSDLIAQIGFTISGLGVSYLPREALTYLSDAGRLVMLEIEPKLSPVPYAAVIRADRESRLTSDVVRIARECCDFSKLVLDVA